MSVDEAAVVLGVGRRLAYEAVRRGELPVIRLGRRLLVPRAALEEMLRAQPERVGSDDVLPRGDIR